MTRNPARLTPGDRIVRDGRIIEVRGIERLTYGVRVFLDTGLTRYLLFYTGAMARLANIVELRTGLAVAA